MKDEKKILIEIKDLKYTYSGHKHALNGLNLKIYEGEKLAVLGSNGAGKSTFFLNLNGVLIPDSGEIIYKNKVMGKKKKDLDQLREAIGIVFQSADNQIIASTVKGEVSFGPMNLGLSRKEVEERVEDALEKMSILDFSDRAPHYLSGGEKKRVAIADIIAMRPEIFVFDEPTAALDPVGAEMLEDSLKLISEAGKTVVVSTHMVDFAWRWADRILVFYNGTVIAEGTPLEIFENKEVLKKARLTDPILLSVSRDLIENGIFPKGTAYAKDVKEFKKICQSLKTIRTEGNTVD